MSKLLQIYLRFWVKFYLKRTKPKIVAITGSISKTSTKEAIFEVLKIKFGKDLRKSEGNLNNETGVPLAIFGFKKSPTKSWQWLPIIIGVKWRALFGQKFKVLVLEMAADKPGDIKYLTDFIKPDISCITSIAPAHLSAFGSIEKIVQEKTDLIRALPCGGWTVLNYDDENLRKLSSTDPQTLTYAIEEKADITAKNITTEIINFKPKTLFQVSSENLKFRATVPTLGRVWNVYSALAAVAVGSIFEMSSADIIKGLENIRSEAHRMSVLKGKNNTLLIDDSYNANPLSMKVALDVLKFLPQPSQGARKIAVLGDMLEIGQISAEAHRLIGQSAKEIADLVISVGKEARKYNGQVHFETAQEAGDFLLANLQKNDIILVKASRAIGLDKVVERLKE
ncbi:MAG: UDP-N-acetylmuramoyl-tripeptide-D-alanyl-D-alanine ligase [Berkelbacteria bacterium GW2011_GWA1_36_9]|uniref:UDP-N-acetylmuramoyl-tripeptide-D-alanyl-D-alanine ligase n=2 Tax=Candidatus Berkelbacteria TaxID=1618330 RepID=A0A0G0FYK3_9BACT|nr:MAG: UDP-N-acetylmuramoyl-tripeptide-D-alanyl-D-alanine ligase [Berkelbacteria bacterium GW2011_GWA1_36_9]